MRGRHQNDGGSSRRQAARFTGRTYWLKSWKNGFVPTRCDAGTPQVPDRHAQCDLRTCRSRRRIVASRRWAALSTFQRPRLARRQARWSRSYNIQGHDPDFLPRSAGPRLSAGSRADVAEGRSDELAPRPSPRGGAGLCLGQVAATDGKRRCRGGCSACSARSLLIYRLDRLV